MNNTWFGTDDIKLSFSDGVNEFSRDDIFEDLE